MALVFHSFQALPFYNTHINLTGVGFLCIIINVFFVVVVFYVYYTHCTYSIIDVWMSIVGTVVLLSIQPFVVPQRVKTTPDRCRLVFFFFF